MWYLCLPLLAGVLAACQAAKLPVRHPDEQAVEDEKPDPSAVQLTFTYGSEKEEWIKEVTADFNQSGVQVGHKRVQVQAIPMGSGECVEEILSGKRKTHLVSPASHAFLVLGNAEGKTKSGKELIAGKTRNLVLSPVVIATWKPMAEALGWPSKPVGWADLKTLAEKEEGWKSLGFPQWGRFKLGHTHPEYSNSGLITVLAEVYAGAGKKSDLTLDDVAKPATAQFVSAIEKAVVHYGSSTGFFGKKMFQNGPDYLSDAVLYENMVVESYDPKYKTAFPVVAIYPKEGTFWSDHPIGVVQRDYVTDEHKQAAEKYIAFLMDKKQQEKAMKYGFRPGLETLDLAAPLDTAHGVDPKQPALELQPPSAEVITAAVKLWKTNKKHAQIVVVMDTSGSMRQEGRMVNAKLGAQQMLRMLDDNDMMSLIGFSNTVNWVEKEGLKVGSNREKLSKHIESFFPAGETALYDAVEAAYKYLQDHSRPDLIQAVVVLTDGEDNKSKLSLEALLKEVKS
jgi:Ca-activated chloride channel family protein